MSIPIIVRRLLNLLGIVEFKMVRLRGGRKEPIWIDTWLTSNEAADPFSTQPCGPQAGWLSFPRCSLDRWDPALEPSPGCAVIITTIPKGTKATLE